MPGEEPVVQEQAGEGSESEEAAADGPEGSEGPGVAKVEPTATKAPKAPASMPPPGMALRSVGGTSYSIFKDERFYEALAHDNGLEGFVKGIMLGIECVDPITGHRRGGNMNNLMLLARLAGRAHESEWAAQWTKVVCFSVERGLMDPWWEELAASMPPAATTLPQAAKTGGKAAKKRSRTR